MQTGSDHGGVADAKVEVDPLIGQILHESYELVRKIGDGGMGTVYEAHHVRLTKKRFAIKVLTASLGSAEVYARFRREAEIATELGHPNIIDVIDFNTTPDGRPYMVMEYLDGQDLGSYLQEVGPLAADQVAEVIEQVGGGLHAAHVRGIVHRDMKPENIFLLHPGDPLRIKVLDFGISKIRDSKTVVTQHNAVFGTPYYMSPEQAEGAVADIDHTTDIFALAAIIYQALSGALPFDAPTIPGVLYRVCHANPEPVTDIVAGLPEELNDVLGRAMAKQKPDRYPSVEHFVAEATVVLRAARNKAGTTALKVHHTATSPASPTTGPQAPGSSSLAAVVVASQGPPPTDVTGPQPPGRTQLRVSQAPAGPGPQASPPPSTLSPTTLSSAAAEIDVLPGAGRRKALVGGILGGLVLIGAVAAMLVFRGGAGPRVDGAATGATADATVVVSTDAAPAAIDDAGPAADGAGQTAAKKAVKIQLELSPAAARVLVDGEARTDNPLLLAPSAERAYELRIEAKGYKTHEQQLRVNADETLRVALARIKRRPPAKRPVTAKPKKPKKPKKPRKLRFDDL